MVEIGSSPANIRMAQSKIRVAQSNIAVAQSNYLHEQRVGAWERGAESVGERSEGGGPFAHP